MKLKEANGLLPRQMRPLDVDYSSTNGSSGRMKVEVSEKFNDFENYSAKLLFL